MILKVGLTGGIGSGKTTVARIFENLGVPVYYADVAARRIMNSDILLIEEIIRAFGPLTYPSGTLDRKYLASLVFDNKEKLNLLNSLVHPATIRDSEKWMAAQKSPYAIKEAALIFESGSQGQLDYIIGVSAPTTLRLARVINRDKSSREQILARMNKQIDESIKMKLCDFVVQNDEQQLVTRQVLVLHDKLLALAAEKESAEPGIANA